MNWLRKRLGLCAHNWEEYDKIERRFTIYVQKCSHCQAIRQYTV